LELAGRRIDFRGSRRSALMLALATAWLATIPLGASASGTTSASVEYRIVLSSNRDGATRAYSMLPGGSRLTPLLSRDKLLTPLTASADGGTVLYRNRRYVLFVSRASGTGLRRVTRTGTFGAALSPDGRFVAFTQEDGRPGIWMIRTDGRETRRLTQRDDSLPAWAPDGSAIVFARSIGEAAAALMVQRLGEPPRVIGYGDLFQIAWSSRGNWIAYSDDRDNPKWNGLWLVRPNGTGRHRVSRRSEAFAWSPDGRRLAVVDRGNLTVLRVGGGATRFRPAAPTRAGIGSVLWAPDGRRLAFTSGYPSQIWLIGADGRRLRAATRTGSNELVGWTPLAPTLPPARPIPRTEKVVGSRALAIGTTVTSLAADGRRVAFSMGSGATDCRHVTVWTPGMSLRRFRVMAPCSNPADKIGPVALAGARVAWLWVSGTGNNEETAVISATLAHPDVQVYYGHAATSRGSGAGDSANAPVGDGNLVVFTVEDYCDPSSEPSEPDCPPDSGGPQLQKTSLYRIGGAQTCADARGCTLVAEADGELDALAVDAGRIVVATDAEVRVLTTAGRVLRSFVGSGDAAALSGNRLAVQSENAIDVYDVSTGRRIIRLPAAEDVKLSDLQDGILVTTSGPTVTLRRLTGGRAISIHQGETARAQLERPGLFVAGDHRLTFTPMAELLRRFG
jgi:hypothetical protein